MVASIKSTRFQIAVAQIAAPGRGRNYYYPAEVRVVDGTQSYWHAVRGLNGGIKFRRKVCGTKHNGPRSEYGQALAVARELAAKLNAADAVAQEIAISESVVI